MSQIIVVEILSDQHGSIARILHPGAQIMFVVFVLDIETMPAIKAVARWVVRIIDARPRVMSVLSSQQTAS